MEHRIRTNHANKVRVEVIPQAIGWRYLRFKVVALAAGQCHAEQTGTDEVALVPLLGQASVRVGRERFEIARRGVFEQMPCVLYVPPGEDLLVEAETAFEFALGGAPAEGRYPLRLVKPAEIKSEIRGGGAARRQVNHLLAPPLEAERLILYEVYVPGGSWSGWPPHGHDGQSGAPYLEETYYFRTDPDYGFALHRNYRPEPPAPFDEVWAVHDGDLVLITQGYHLTAAAPNCNLYFLNYLAGELRDKARATAPSDDPTFAWLKGNWEANVWTLPHVGP